jgi:hypothetical protein
MINIALIVEKETYRYAEVKRDEDSIAKWADITLVEGSAKSPHTPKRG